MRVAVTGSTGFIGSALVTSLAEAGHDVSRLRRPEPADGEVGPRDRGEGPGDAIWDPLRGVVEGDRLEGTAAVVHLAGEPLGARRWSPMHKARVLQSRVEGTGLIASAVSRLHSPPAVFVSASAVGYYGDRGDDVLTEESPPGTGFLAELCRKWEAAAAPVADAGIRLVILRTGLVIERGGGVLKRQLPLFRLGLGGRLGSGRQYLSWVSLPDAIGAIVRCVTEPSLSGPVNITAPAPVTGSEFAATLGRVLRRPALLPAPPSILRIALGREMADEMALASQRALPVRLTEDGYSFCHPTLEKALRATLASV